MKNTANAVAIDSTVQVPVATAVMFTISYGNRRGNDDIDRYQHEQGCR